MSEALAKRTLPDCEAVIERWLATFVDVGGALLEIRDSRLYRDTHGTFEDYCRERWGLSKPYASQLIVASETVAIATTDGQPEPRNEAVARELAPLRDEPEQLRAAWSESVELHGDKPTAAEVREVVDEKRNGKMAVHYSSATDEWATPQDFFDVVNAEFDFDLDACALDSSAKCERYFTPENDGLAQAWTGTVWMNPPYGDAIGQWVEKAHDSATAGATVVCLVPARTDTKWFQQVCFTGEVRFIAGRLRFGDANASAPFPSALVCLGPSFQPCAFGWEWR